MPPERELISAAFTPRGLVRRRKIGVGIIELNLRIGHTCGNLKGQWEILILSYMGYWGRWKLRDHFSDTLLTGAPIFVGIQPILAALWSLALCDAAGACSGDFGGGRHLRVSGESIACCGEGVHSVLSGG